MVNPISVSFFLGAVVNNTLLLSQSLKEEVVMTIPKLKLLPLVFAALALAVPGLAFANADLAKQISNSNQWAHHSGNFSLHRYSTLNQINKDNVGKMKVAWTFSTGVLR
ncbi:MAG: hypothetical protein ACREVA_04255, partial [Burkholderiales bacterium]